MTALDALLSKIGALSGKDFDIAIMQTSEQRQLKEAQEYERREVEDLTRPPDLKSQKPCISCKGSNVAFRIEQTRSADEGGSARHTCYDCGITWFA